MKGVSKEEGKRDKKKRVMYLTSVAVCFILNENWSTCKEKPEKTRTDARQSVAKKWHIRPEDE